jgi:type I toxin-antitoxin system toxin SymE
VQIIWLSGYNKVAWSILPFQQASSVLMKRRTTKGQQLDIFESAKEDSNGISDIKIRRLKIQYGHYHNSYHRHPVIRLAGKWLAGVDFKIDDTIEVAAEKGRIIITKVPHKK